MRPGRCLVFYEHLFTAPLNQGKWLGWHFPSEDFITGHMIKKDIAKPNTSFTFRQVFSAFVHIHYARACMFFFSFSRRHHGMRSFLESSARPQVARVRAYGDSEGRCSVVCRYRRTACESHIVHVRVESLCTADDNLCSD